MASEPGDDVSRFTALFERAYPAVLAYARRRVSVDAAEEIVADTFLAAWRRLAAIPDDPLPWLYRCAHLEILRHYREHQRADSLQRRLVEKHRGYASDVGDRIASRELLVRALQALNARDRETLQLTAWEELSAADAAVVLGCSVVAFRVRLHRARRRFERLVADLESPTSIAAVQGSSAALDRAPNPDPAVISQRAKRGDLR